jgi:predicted pyridoxine 5'-phosphate oxidase superfamily flavin-nucleotide-binding protein
MIGAAYSAALPNLLLTLIKNRDRYELGGAAARPAGPATLTARRGTSMARAFTEFTFTPSVKAAQLLYGSRTANQRLEEAEEPADELTELERAFIEARDSFYQATVTETGWPYVQFRGGPAGFLHVITSKQIAYADFRGNIQYLSVGNINADGRVALILMDYPNRRRLKIWGQARVVHTADAPDLLASLKKPGYRARVERAIVIDVKAFDWNCPQHITPRFTEAEVEAAIAPLRAEIEALRARIAGAPGDASADGALP